jgi:HK97 family phage prohead protease
MSGVELRSTSDGKLTLRGHASVFDNWYPISSRFEEVVRSGAFKRTLKNDHGAQGPDVVLLVEHEGLPLARTRSPTGKPTLRLREDEKGLFAEGELDPRNPKVQELKSVAEHTGLAMSFGFQCTDEAWSKDMSKREVKAVNLHKGDVTASARPANPATGMTIDERAGVEGYSLEERRAFALEMKGQPERRMCPGFDVSFLDETRAGKYAAHTIAEMGAKGQAYGPAVDGHWSFPVGDRDDLEKGIQAVGRSGASHNGVRKYLIGRSRALGLSHLIPDNWAPSGALRSISMPDYTAIAEQELDLLAARYDMTIRLGMSPRAVVNARAQRQQNQLDVLAHRAKR